MKLTEHEIASPLWQKLNDYFNSRLLHLRTENDKDAGDVPTAKLRGRIAEVQRTINLGKPQDEIEIE